MSKTMKALVKTKAAPGIWMEEVPVPTIGPDDVLIKIKKTSICGTDVHIYDWNDWAQKTIKVPMVIGHEYVGEIVEIGKNVTDLTIGQIVTGEGHIFCGKCRNCRSGVRHLCPNTIGVGVNRDGAFAEYLSLPAQNVWPTDPSIDEELYSIFDPFGNAVHTALSYNLVAQDVLITGAGPIGIMAAAVAQKVGATNVVLTDITPYRIELAKQMGIHKVYDTTQTSIKDIRDSLGIIDGFTVAMEMSGSSIAFNDMLQNMIMGGKIALLAVQNPDTLVDWNKIVFGGLFLKGIYGREIFNTWFQMENLIKSGLDISPIITHRYSIDEFKKGFEVMASGNAGKVILNWEA